jgi:hypothetical protein
MEVGTAAMCKSCFIEQDVEWLHIIEEAVNWTQIFQDSQ